jgi:predicted component of viral defense system (DUF524 family)
MTAGGGATAVITIAASDGRSAGVFEVWPLPRLAASAEHPLIEAGDGSVDVKLFEGVSYAYRAELGASAALRIEPAEFFEPHDPNGFNGRLLPREAVGSVPLQFFNGDEFLGACTIDVRPRKLQYDSEFLQMLRDIGDWAAEAILQGFAPAHGYFSPAGDAEARTLYRRFAFLAARLEDPLFDAALGRILARPHREWRVELEPRPPGRPQPPGAALARRLTAPGPRVTTPADPLRSIPRALPTGRTEESRDTLPNRFVKAALSDWSDLARAVAGQSDSSVSTGPSRRGQAAATRVAETLDAALGDPLFRDVGVLRRSPGANQVLLKAEGYRDVARLAALVDAGMQLEVPDEVDPFAASQRSVSTLYEYWVFLVLADVVGEACGHQAELLKLFKAGSTGMSLGLRTGEEARLSWDARRLGYDLQVTLFFNRTFLGRQDAGGDVSWTRPMRPDCSLHFRSSGRDGRPDDETWIHFDAKYRVESVTGQFAPPSEAEQHEEAAAAVTAEALGRSRRDDLLKMHAYRDAIRRSSGAYVLYPGNDRPLRFSEFHELLPGLGAFALRPGEQGTAGRADLRDFIDRSLDHFAAQATRHERMRFWQEQVFRGPARSWGVATEPVGFLDKPAADIDVVLGYAKSDAHAAWIDERRLYNVRSGDRPGAVSPRSRVLGATFLLVYGATMRSRALYRVVGAWRATRAADLASLGYPEPRGELYLCVEVSQVEPPEWLIPLDLSALLRGGLFGEPSAVTWFDLMEAAARAAASKPAP